MVAPLLGTRQATHTPSIPQPHNATHANMLNSGYCHTCVLVFTAGLPAQQPGLCQLRCAVVLQHIRCYMWCKSSLDSNCPVFSTMALTDCVSEYPRLARANSVAEIGICDATQPPEILPEFTRIRDCPCSKQAPHKHTKTSSSAILLRMQCIVVRS